MPISAEVRKLQAKWETNTGWPKRLEWIEIDNLRGWTGQRFQFSFPIMAVVGENGAGKSTVLQCAAGVYRPPAHTKGHFVSDFLPDTAWDKIRMAEVRYSVVEHGKRHVRSIRKPGERWRGNPQRRERPVVYIDLSRVLPIAARVGYSNLAKPQHAEKTAQPFDKYRLGRFAQIMGHQYDGAKMAWTHAYEHRPVPVLSQQNAIYSGFHQGAGETTIAELLEKDFPKYSIVLIDEFESSLHPRAQRRLVRDLAERCRESELQVVLSTHSPYVLEELPLLARACILQMDSARQIVYGVSPEFAMTKMDDHAHHECDLYVEDDRAARLLIEILTMHAPGLVQRCRTIAYGASSVGQSLGQMAYQRRFPQPSCVFLDGDRGTSPGCINLPGDDAPERVVFEGLARVQWAKVPDRVLRPFSDFSDACAAAMTLNNHHDWVRHAASRLIMGGDTLWQALCSEWASRILTLQDAKPIADSIEAALQGLAPPMAEVAPVVASTPESAASASGVGSARRPIVSKPAPTETLPLFGRSRGGVKQ